MRRPMAKSAETLLAEAVEIDDLAERASFLDRACGADAELRRSLQSLIDDFFAADGLLHPPVLAAGDTSLDPASESAVEIEHFKIREMIGQGGMGIVYVADQVSPVARRVALKVIKPGMDSHQVIGRFESERQALALMDHPYIAKVLGGGATKEGRPYFVMELVKGASITEFCESRRLSQRDRLKLFAKVCSAVEHAHQKGIIHRDLKPSNILVAMHDDAAAAISEGRC
jgi:serine/threonine protein kinase